MKYPNDEPSDNPTDDPTGDDRPVVKHCGEDGLTPEEYEQMEWDAFDSGEPTITNDGNYPSQEETETEDEED